MSELKITCNKRKRDRVDWYALPEKAQKDFNYVKDGYDLRFVKYKGDWIDVADVQRIRVGEYRPGWDMCVQPDHPFAGWHAIISDSFFSGLLIRYCDDEQVVIGRYTC